MPTYEVRFVRTTREYLLVRVEARTKLNAIKEARKLAKERVDDFCDGTQGRVSFDGIWEQKELDSKGCNCPLELTGMRHLEDCRRNE